MKTEDLLVEFAENWVSAHPRKLNKGERKIVIEFAEIITQMMVINKERKNK